MKLGKMQDLLIKRSLHIRYISSFVPPFFTF